MAAAVQRGGGVKFSVVDVSVDEFLPDSDGLDWFEGLVPWTMDELEGLGREARNRAIVISGAETDAQVSRVKDLIGDYIKTGKTLAEFQSDFAGLWADMGLEGKRPHEVENLFRSETMRAYGAGRSMALRSDAAQEAFPLWEYMAVLDDRARPEHAALHGVVLPADDPFWYTHTPPWDYQCRCDVVPVSRREIEKGGVEVTGDVTLEDGTVVSVSSFPGASSGFRGVGF
ncbi:hypothetical protein CVU37_15115 [candidate division BRC1 bacterium HGW-BRC1-1]|nr:MAG: hypothetical protein CVU37_15115 [candidate division BRC1 bacterium HGW-BRC1-1]